MVDNIVRAEVFYIAREAATNAARHAGAGHIHIRLTAGPESVLLEVDDDGIGIPSDHADRGGVGLRIMQYRAKAINGDLKIEARKPSGTRVVCRVPVA